MCQNQNIMTFEGDVGLHFSLLGKSSFSWYKSLIFKYKSEFFQLIKLKYHYRGITWTLACVINILKLKNN